MWDGAEAWMLCTPQFSLWEVMRSWGACLMRGIRALIKETRDTFCPFATNGAVCGAQALTTCICWCLNGGLHSLHNCKHKFLLNVSHPAYGILLPPKFLLRWHSDLLLEICKLYPIPCLRPFALLCSGFPHSTYNLLTHSVMYLPVVLFVSFSPLGWNASPVRAGVLIVVTDTQ
jgi:hypothetical protein